MMSGLGQNLQFLQPQNITNIIPVSYTHLDVYKRQMLGHLGFTALTSGGNAEEQAKISTKMQELQSYIDRFYLFDYDEENVESAVSYTHLDVYKRQS